MKLLILLLLLLASPASAQVIADSLSVYDAGHSALSHALSHRVRLGTNYIRTVICRGGNLVSGVSFGAQTMTRTSLRGEVSAWAVRSPTVGDGLVTVTLSSRGSVSFTTVSFIGVGIVDVGAVTGIRTTRVKGATFAGISVAVDETVTGNAIMEATCGKNASSDEILR